MNKTQKLKVYSWIGNRSECPRTAGGSGQTREIVSAPSKAAARTVGAPSNITETGARDEVETALASPGVVLWRPLDVHGHFFVRAGEAWDGPRLAWSAGIDSEAEHDGLRCGIGWKRGGYEPWCGVGDRLLRGPIVTEDPHRAKLAAEALLRAQAKIEIAALQGLLTLLGDVSGS